VSTIHASAVLVGAKAALIRGPAGSGKSQLVWQLIEAATQDTLPFARLVADDRAHIQTCGGRLVVRPSAELAGLIEIRGLGVRRLPHESMAVLGLVVDLAAADGERLPGAEAGKTSIDGVVLPRLAIAPGQPALIPVLAYLRTLPAAN